MYYVGLWAVVGHSNLVQIVFGQGMIIYFQHSDQKLFLFLPP